MKGMHDHVSNKAHLIQFEKKHAIDGFGVLVRNGQVAAYADNTYVVGDEHLKILQKAGVPYKVLRE